MEYYNEFTIEYDTKENALSQKTLIEHCLDDIDVTKYGYSESYNYGEVFRKLLTFDGEKKFEYGIKGAPDGFVTPEDSLEVLPIMARKLAIDKKDAGFIISSENSGSYTDSTVKIEYKNGKLTIDTIYYPSGDFESLICRECGEELVTIEEYEKGKIYICPECGAECDLSDDYEEAVPIIEHKEEII